MVTKKIVVQGKVQGVAYRASTVTEAISIGGLKGWVRNLSNGDVEILVQGSPEKVAVLIAWARKGPSLARVNHVDVQDVNPQPNDLNEFEIKR